MTDRQSAAQAAYEAHQNALGLSVPPLTEVEQKAWEAAVQAAVDLLASRSKVIPNTDPPPGGGHTGP